MMERRTYKSFRSTICTGDLLAWTHRGWGSWYDIQIQLVRMFTRSEYAHVGLAWVVSGRVFVLEAVGSGVRIYPLSKLGDFYYIPVKGLSPKAEEFALQQIGEAYSKVYAIKAFLGLLRRKDDHVWQCAKYANMVLQKNGLDFKNALTPSQLVDAVLPHSCLYHIMGDKHGRRT